MVYDSFRIKSQLVLIDFNVENDCIIRQRYNSGIRENGQLPLQLSMMMSRIPIHIFKKKYFRLSTI